MRAERDGAGAHRYTREQVAEACLVSVATVKRLERRLTGPPGAPRHLDAVSFPDPPVSAPRSRGTARQQSEEQYAWPLTFFSAGSSGALTWLFRPRRRR